MEAPIKTMRVQRNNRIIRKTHPYTLHGMQKLQRRKSKHREHSSKTKRENKLMNDTTLMNITIEVDENETTIGFFRVNSQTKLTKKEKNYLNKLEQHLLSIVDKTPQTLEKHTPEDHHWHLFAAIPDKTNLERLIGKWNIQNTKH